MEKLTFNKLLTWNDILSLGDPRGDTSVYLDKNFFECCCNRNYDIKRFNDNVLKYVYDDFNNQFSDFPFNLENYDFRISYIKDDNGVWHFKFSKEYFVLWLLELANGDNFNSQQKDRIIV